MTYETTEAELMTCLIKACRQHKGVVSPEVSDEICQAFDAATLTTRESACDRLEITWAKNPSKPSEYYLFAVGENSLLGMSHAEIKDKEKRLVSTTKEAKRPQGFNSALMGLLMTIFVDWAYDPNRGGDHLAIDCPEIETYMDRVESTIEANRERFGSDRSLEMISEVCEYLSGLVSSTTESRREDRKRTQSIAACCREFMERLADYGLVEESDLKNDHIRPTGKMCALYSVHIASRSGAYEEINDIIAEKETYHA